MPHRKKFVHLHVHSEFSLLDGAARITDLVAAAHHLGMPALALTDHGNMYAAIKFYNAALAQGLKPIIGCEMYLAPRRRFDKETKEDRSPHHLTVLASNQTGYQNLLKLVSLASLEGFYAKPRIDQELLERYAAGLIVLSGCPKGQIPALLAADRYTEAKKVAGWYRELLGENFYLEVQDLKIPEFQELVPQLIKLGRELDIQPVATNDVHYLNQADAYFQDVLLGIGTGALLADAKRLKMQSQEFYLKPFEEMAALFVDCPAAISSTLAIAEKCNLEIEQDKLHLPNFPVPATETPESYLEKLVWVGIKKKYGQGEEEDKILLPPEIIDRVKYELYTIEKMGYAPYFLIVQDFINYAKSQGIRVGPGRGSAAGSLVSYALNITNVDPLKYGLIFERFLNIERVTMPDIDIDFDFERRNEVLEYVTRKYGKDHVAQIVTFGTMAARGSIRDVGRVLQVPLPEVDKIAKLIPFAPDVTIDKALGSVKELKAIYDQDEKIKALIDTARQVEGLSRHASVHAAGVVISEAPLNEYVPLQQLEENVTVTQYTMEDLEKIGLLKMDFLGLRNLTILSQTLAIISRTRQEDIDLDKIPLNDPKTFSLLCNGETVGIFQLESRGMQGLIKDLHPTNFEEIIALLALYRPGPLESGMVEDYVKRKNHQVKVTYELPELQPILRETHGVILYQEQVMEIASKIAGFSMGQADILRQAMGKKKTKEMQQQKEFFIEGAVKRGVSRHKATELFNLCAKFAGYGFNKSHSTAYGIISYQTAYFKANYPLEFMAALLTSVIANTDKLAIYLSECRRMKIKVLPPDINESFRNFTVTAEGIRFGLSAVRNVGVAAIDSIIAAKKADGPFRSLTDFCERIDARAANKKVVESLVKAGAFDSFGLGRAYLLNNLANLIGRASNRQKEQANGQAALFQVAESRAPLPEDSQAEPPDEFSPEQILRMEKEMLGLYISQHPLEFLRDSLEEQTNQQIADLTELREGETVKIGGLLSDCRKLTTRRGDAMLVAKIEDLTGSIPLVVFPKTYAKAAALLNDDEVVVVSGKINRDMRSDDYNVVADSVEPMVELEKVRSLYIELVGLKDHRVLNRMKEVLSFFKGADPVFLRMDGKRIALGKNQLVDINPELIAQLENLLGSGSVNVEFKAVKKEAANGSQFN
jgi:DNA polymerase-3 subunit alpha